MSPEIPAAARRNGAIVVMPPGRTAGRNRATHAVAPPTTAGREAQRDSRSLDSTACLCIRNTTTQPQKPAGPGRPSAGQKASRALTLPAKDDPWPV
jgi:hypothetical protein